jgi:hypothetical protein
MVETPERSPVRLAVPFEKQLIGTDNRRYAVCGDVSLFQFGQIVCPKLIFDKDSHAGIG